VKQPGFITIEQEGRESWRMLVLERDGGQLLYEARGLRSLDEALEELARWRKGVVIV
jgi:hypothetical protein